MASDDTTPRLLQQLREQLTEFRSHVDTRLDRVDKRLDSIEARMRLQQAGTESLAVDV